MMPNFCMRLSDESELSMFMCAHTSVDRWSTHNRSTKHTQHVSHRKLGNAAAAATLSAQQDINSYALCMQVLTVGMYFAQALARSERCQHYTQMLYSSNLLL
jgi:hypothetical protein